MMLKNVEAIWNKTKLSLHDYEKITRLFVIYHHDVVCISGNALVGYYDKFSWLY